MKLLLAFTATLFTFNAFAGFTTEQLSCAVKTQIPLSQLIHPRKNIIYNKAVELIAEEVNAMNAAGGFSLINTAKTTREIKENIALLNETLAEIQGNLGQINRVARGGRVYSGGAGKWAVSTLKGLGELATPTGVFIFGGGMAQIPGLPALDRVSGSFVIGQVFVPMWTTYQKKVDDKGACDEIFEAYGTEFDSEGKYSTVEMSRATIYVPIVDTNLVRDKKLGVRAGIGAFWGDVEKASDFEGLVAAQSMSRVFGKWLPKSMQTVVEARNCKIGFVVPNVLGVVKDVSGLKKTMVMAMVGGDKYFRVPESKKTPDAGTVVASGGRTPNRQNIGMIFSQQQYLEASLANFDLEALCQDQFSGGQEVLDDAGVPIELSDTSKNFCKSFAKQKPKKTDRK